MLKRARHNPTRIMAEAAALRLLARRAVPHTPRPLLVDTSHPVRAMLLSWLGHRPTPLDAALAEGEVPDASFMTLGHHIARLHQIEVPPGAIKLSDDPTPWPDRMRLQAQRAVDSFHSRMTPDDPDDMRDSERLRDSIEAIAARLHTLDLPDRPDHLIHRDLRPANILLGTDREFSGIVDFERAACGDPAWDIVKLRWWLIDLHPRAAAPLWRGYRQVRPPPDPARVELYTLHEALGLLTYFAGRHPIYPDEARRQLDALLAGAPAPRWRAPV